MVPAGRSIWPRSRGLFVNKESICMIQKGSFASKHKPDEAEETSTDYAAQKASQTSDFFGAGVAATIGTVFQKAKEAVGMEKPLGKEGAKSMEPAGTMENKSDQGNRTAQFEELVGKQKQQSEELQGGVKPEELYSQAAKNRAGESGPPSKSA